MVTPSSPVTPRKAKARRARRATAIGLAGLGIVAVCVLVLSGTQPRRLTRHRGPVQQTIAYVPRRSRLDAHDWTTVRNVVRLRAMALAPRRTAMYRSFAAYMGLSGLLTLHHVLRGRCAVAVSYLYDNLLDLHDAYPGEDWRPLRRLVSRQPSLSVCAPKPAPEVTYVS